MHTFNSTTRIQRHLVTSIFDLRGGVLNKSHKLYLCKRPSIKKNQGAIIFDDYITFVTLKYET